MAPRCSPSREVVLVVELVVRVSLGCPGCCQTFHARPLPASDFPARVEDALQIDFRFITPPLMRRPRAAALESRSGSGAVETAALGALQIESIIFQKHFAHPRTPLKYSRRQRIRWLLERADKCKLKVVPSDDNDDDDDVDDDVDGVFLPDDG
ncbi:hypothetical protein M5D96_014074 [Drosophila gunungcola]|uniref:Uncharacterized protein n=1 Tax=Drosophila gunungcola TaxID=103775 RepID=A0A9P9YAP5_9MUSC|nr:hypothetical protein M5D96_014074 [Drosophila gunungcola]